MALFCLETFKGRTTIKMESNSKLENSFKGKDRLPKSIPNIDYVKMEFKGLFFHANMLSRYFSVAYLCLWQTINSQHKRSSVTNNKVISRDVVQHGWKVCHNGIMELKTRVIDCKDVKCRFSSETLPCGSTCATLWRAEHRMWRVHVQCPVRWCHGFFLPSSWTESENKYTCMQYRF